MKKIFNWQIILGIVFVVISVLVYLLHYAIFRDAHHIFLYLIGDIAFVFFEVLLVTLVIHKLLHFREKQALIKKLNMVIGAFYSEVGTELLKKYSCFISDSDRIDRKLKSVKDWGERDFNDILCEVEGVSFVSVDSRKCRISEFREFLVSKRAFLITLLENPNLLEHESFTDLLWAVFHLTEELASRKNTDRLSPKDMEHISGDLKRAYQRLVYEWVSYMKHLKDDYPYLFSLAVRKNPFDKNATVEIS